MNPFRGKVTLLSIKKNKYVDADDVDNDMITSCDISVWPTKCHSFFSVVTVLTNQFSQLNADTWDL